MNNDEERPFWCRQLVDFELKRIGSLGVTHEFINDWEQAEGTAKYDSYCQAQIKIMELEKKYGKSMKFQVCKIMDTNNG